MFSILKPQTLERLAQLPFRTLVNALRETLDAYAVKAADVKVTGDGVKVTGDVKVTADGVNDNGRELLHLETRRLCRCHACYGIHSHQNLPTTLPTGVKVSRILEVSENYISMQWSDGHSGKVPRTMVGAYGPMTSLLERYYDVTMRKNSAQEFWRGQDEDNFRAFEYNEVVRSDENTSEFLAHYMKYGIGFLRGIPQSRDCIEFVDTDLKIGRPRVTVFDRIDMVKFKPDANNFAYSSTELPPHTDLNYYNDTPSVQFFICSKNSVQGGHSFWIDSFAALQEVQEERPHFFEILAKVPIFAKHDPPGLKRNLYASSPMLQLNGQDMQRVRDNIGCFDEYQFSVSTDITTRKLWWDAFSFYRTKIGEESRRITHLMRAGDLVMTDNWRVYHGRKAFTVTAPGQERNVATWYVDWNHLQNRMLSVSDGFLDLNS